MNLQLKLFSIDYKNLGNGNIKQFAKDEYDVISFNVVHNKFDFAKANIKLSKPIKSLDDYFVLCDIGTIFVGKITKDATDNEYALEAVPFDFKEQRESIHKLDKKFVKSFICEEDLIYWSSTTLKGHFFLDEYIREFEANENNCYSINVVNNYKKPSLQIKIHLRWNRFFNEIIDLGDKIFGSNGIQTCTPKAILNQWPAEGSMHKGFYVTKSDVEIDSVDLDKVDDTYYKVSTIKGSLVVSRNCQEENYEIWEIPWNIKSDQESKDVNLYLDLADYFADYPCWEGDKEYKKDDIVLVEAYDHYEIFVCKEDNKSSKFDEKLWTRADEGYLSCSENLFLDSKIGKDFLKETLKYFFMDFYFQNPCKTIEINAPFELWKLVDIGDMINVNVNGEMIRANVVKYKKSYEYGRANVTLTCNAYENLRKDIEEANCSFTYEANSTRNKERMCEVEVTNDYSVQRTKSKDFATNMNIRLSKDKVVVCSVVKIKYDSWGNGRW